jgi:hypothetical protein
MDNPSICLLDYQPNRIFNNHLYELDLGIYWENLAMIFAGAINKNFGGMKLKNVEADFDCPLQSFTIGAKFRTNSNAVDVVRQ